MSTKISIKSSSGPGASFHLFDEAFDPGHVYLELKDVEFMANSGPETGAYVRVRIPTELAKVPSLVPPDHKGLFGADSGN